MDAKKPDVGLTFCSLAEMALGRGMVIGGSFYATMLAVFAFGIVLFKTQERFWRKIDVEGFTG